jgi:hypothetical protein
VPSKPIGICLEAGRRLTLASAIEWPGWARSGRGEEAAVEALRGYAPRYAPVAVAAGLEPPDAGALAVLERLEGSASTDFGVPGAIARIERASLQGSGLDRLLSLVEACWRRFDDVVAAAPASLRKGPRGGGRDRDAIWDHVVGPEAESYARKIGVRLPVPRRAAPAELREHRESLLAALRERAAQPEVAKGWPARYAIRRMAWHVLDHTWEIEDRSEPG